MIGLYDVDSTIPNLALMQASAFYKERGERVEHYSSLAKDSYDLILASSVFTSPSLSDKSKLDLERMRIGGTGWDGLMRTVGWVLDYNSYPSEVVKPLRAAQTVGLISAPISAPLEKESFTVTEYGRKAYAKWVASPKDLPTEIQSHKPDYSLYNYPHSIGFTMRGCRFRCKPCVVPNKEGRPKSNQTIDEIWVNRDSDFIMLLDNDFFGNPQWRERVAEIRKHDLQVNFSQGLNIRIITEEQCKALAGVRFCNPKQTKKQVYFAWDRFNDERLIDAGIERVKAAGIKPWQMAFYVLVGFDTTPEQDLYRILKLKDLGCDPYAMPFDRDDPYQQRLVRWVEHKAAFKSTSFQNYRPNMRGKRVGKNQEIFRFEGEAHPELSPLV